jgi:hypothetical protein
MCAAAVPGRTGSTMPDTFCRSPRASLSEDIQNGGRNEESSFQYTIVMHLLIVARKCTSVQLLTSDKSRQDDESDANPPEDEKRLSRPLLHKGPALDDEECLAPACWVVRRQRRQLLLVVIFVRPYVGVNCDMRCRRDFRILRGHLCGWSATRS